MKKTVLIMFTLVLFALATSPLMAHGKTIVVQLLGSATGETRIVTGDTGDPVSANCFDVDLVLPASGMVIGTASDCLSNATDYEPQFGNKPVELTDTTIFNLPGGAIVSVGRVSIQPVIDPASAPTRTHITGSVPEAGTKTILPEQGTRRFKNRTGSVRLSGAVNMSKFDSDNIIDFDCLFVIDLDKKKQGR